MIDFHVLNYIKSSLNLLLKLLTNIFITKTSFFCVFLFIEYKKNEKL